VGVDLGVRSRGNRAAQAGARQAAVCAEPDGSDFADAPEVRRFFPQRFRRAERLGAFLHGLDAEESLAEFRELVASAGGVVVAEMMQRRAGPIRPR
jgi:GTP-binding protein HflX